jgi:hypothetical protein
MGICNQMAILRDRIAAAQTRQNNVATTAFGALRPRRQDNPHHLWQ